MLNRIFDKNRLIPTLYSRSLIAQLRAGYFSPLTTLSRNDHTNPTSEETVAISFYCEIQPYFLVAGMEEVLTLLQIGTGYYEENHRFRNTFAHLNLCYHKDGELIRQERLIERIPVLTIQGRYSEFYHLLSIIEQLLTFSIQTATSLYRVLVTLHKKTIYIQPSSYYDYRQQLRSGLVYEIATRRYNLDYQEHPTVMVSTLAQSVYSHLPVFNVMNEPMMNDRLQEVDIKCVRYVESIADNEEIVITVDNNQYAIPTTIRVIAALWRIYWEKRQNGSIAEANRYQLDWIRLSTPMHLRDQSLPLVFAKDLNYGINPRLIAEVRSAIEELKTTLIQHYSYLQLREAKQVVNTFCNHIKILVDSDLSVSQIIEYETNETKIDAYAINLEKWASFYEIDKKVNYQYEPTSRE